jgi:hypothetical protein
LYLRFSLFIALTILILCATPQCARAGEASPASPVCGKTVEDNLTAARQALQSSDKDSRAALACLIEATSALNDRLSAGGSGQARSGLAHMPVLDVPVKTGGQ